MCHNIALLPNATWPQGTWGETELGSFFIMGQHG